jgi:tetratricopeptide (TPR) repeat protein
VAAEQDQPDQEAVFHSLNSSLNPASGASAVETGMEPETADPKPVTDFEAMTLDRAQTLYDQGRMLFEAGRYREAIESLETGAALLPANGRLGGEMQVWLVTAYEAAGLQDAALQLCRQLTKHPHLETRSQARRLLAILEAPVLSKRPEWLTEIPDLSSLEAADGAGFKAATGQAPSRSPRSRPMPEPKPIDPALIVHENRFLGFGLLLVTLVIAGILWLGHTQGG